jgi:hypothetical protein
MLRSVVATTVAVLATAAPASAGGGWLWPVEGRVISRFDFHASAPYKGGQHRGIDIAARLGTPVVAATAGTVAFAGDLGDSGTAVSIETRDGRLRTSYLHLSAVSVARGQEVDRGQAIGTSGTSGRPSRAVPHLHFGVRADGRPAGYLDPLGFLREPGDERPPPVGPGGLRRRPDVRPFVVPRRVPLRFSAGFDPGLVVAGMALAFLAACLGAPAPRRAVSSIARRWVITSQRRSTT